MTSPRGAQDAADGVHDPFAGGALLRVVPTTEPQREVWLADRLGDDASLAYNESCALRLRGALDADALARAVQALIDRHDALRSTVGPDGETLCVAAPFEIPVPVVDLSELSGDARTQAIAAHERQAVDTPFALDRGPLFRASLLRLSSEEHRLLLGAHHIVCDGWSWWLLVRELADLYALETGAEVPAEALAAPASFADYALGLARRGRDAQALEDEHYWLDRFTDAVPVLELPTDRPRPARRAFASAREDVVIDAALIAEVRALGARRGASLFATLLGTFATLLSRLAGQSTVVVGIPAAGQSVDGHAGVVGHCVNLLPLRFDLDAAMPFTALVDAAQDTLLDAIDHQRMTFGTLLQRLQVDRDPGRPPLVSVMFNIDQALDRDARRFPGLEVGFDSIPRSHEAFELFVNAVQRDGALVLECQYGSALFDAATVRRWMGAFATLLRGAVRAPDAAIGSLPLLDAAGRAALDALQPPPTPFDRGCAMHQLFERQCGRMPARIALRHGDVAWTYAELDARANRIAALLRARGVHAGALVGLALERSPDLLAALLGILKTGAGYVPLDPAFPAARLAHMVGDAGLAALVTQTALAERFDLRGRPVLALDALRDALDAASPARVAQAIAPESVAYVIYTSGSTGVPKGVQVPHRAVANFITAMQARPGIAADDVMVAVTTLSFDIAVLELLLPLSVGAQVVLAEREVAMDGAALAALLRDSDATLMQATPSTWRMLVEAGWQGGAGFRALCGGEPLPVDLAQALVARSGATWNLYGPTETTVWSTCWRVGEPERGVSIGTPIANTSVWVLDAQGQPCPLGVPGELCIGGDGVTLGYLGRDALTSDRFIADAFAVRDNANGTPSRLYRTGDRGRWRADGTLEHLGRLDFQVKVRGYRIELGEIETALARLPGITQAVALVREDRPGDVRLVGYVVAPPDARAAAIDERATLDALRGTLPDYMLPQHLVALDALPLLPNGKIDRAALPVPEAPVPDAARVAPSSDAERGVAAAMAQVLGVAEVGIHDDFFALGGHSLLAAQLVSRLNRELGLRIGLRALFDGPTVAQLAALTADPAAPNVAPRAPIPRRADQSQAPLSLMQERLWMLAQFAPGQLTYNTPSAHRLGGALDVARFVRAFDAVVARQSILRTSIVAVDGVPMQRIHPKVDSGLAAVVDLTALPADARDATARAQIDALVHQPIAMTDAPMFVARLFRLAPDEHILFFMPHHAIWDGWSFDLLYTELAEAYGALERGALPSQAPLPVSYGDYAAWHRGWFDGPEYAAQLAFWRAHLRVTADAPLRALPTDAPRTPGMSGEARALPVALTRTLTDRLHAAAVQLDATLFVTLLAAFDALIAAIGGQPAVIVATPVRGRNDDQTEPLMGYFTNLLPLRVAIDPAQPFADLVRTVKAAVLDGFAHPDVRLEDLMRELSVRDAAGTVLYHALFSFQDIRQRALRWGSLRHERVETATPGATEDLGLWFVESEHGLSGALNHNVALFTDATAALVWQRYATMLESLARDPSQTVTELTCFDDGRPALIGTSRSPDAAPPATLLRTGAIAPAETVAAAGNPQADALQALVTQAWVEVLGIEAVQPDDDFFALGGHSLQAVQLFHRLARATGVNLPLATLLSASTVRELAAAYAAAGTRVATTDVPLPTRADGAWRALVPMRPGGDAAPLFFVHAVGGNVLNYRPLALRMPDQMPVYGLQARGLDGRAAPLDCIEAMARRYIAEIRSVQPHGPYHLAGGSMGGMIAYEIAQQLVAAGETVALLALIDTSSRYGSQWRDGNGGVLARLRQLRERSRGLSSLQALRAVAGRLRARRAVVRDARDIAALRHAGQEIPHTLRYADIERAHYAAYRAYVVRPYPGEVTLFRAVGEGVAPCDPSLGWNALVGALRVVDIPGDHRSIIEEPQLSQALNESIAALRRPAPTRADTPVRAGSQAAGKRMHHV